jgi:anaerobic dimethyl sulfoxide reductase subunit C (anchor subunit)
MSIQWPLVIFTLLAGCGAGTLVFLGLAELLNVGKKVKAIAAWVAVVLFVIGGIASVLHLGKPANFMAAVGNLGSLSGISIELILLGLGVVVAVIYALVARNNSGAVKAVSVIALIVGLVFAWALGSSYVIGSRAAWDSQVLPFAYLGSGLAMGGFLYLAFLVAKKEDSEGIKKVALFVLLASAIELIAFLAFGLAAGDVVIADNAILFWGAAVVVGAVLPLIAAIVIWRNTKSASLVYIGLVTALVGGVALRALMWLAGSPAIVNLFDVASQNRGLYPF